MKRRERIARLLRLARLAETEAGRRVAESASRLTAKEAEIERLRRFLADYRAGGDSERAALDAGSWSNACAFEERLRAAIDAGEREAADIAARYGESAERWQAVHRRHNALRDVAARHAEEDVRDDARREQIEVDDRFARRK